MRPRPAISLDFDTGSEFVRRVRQHLRAAARLCGFFALLALAEIEWGCAPRFRDPARERQTRARWLQRLCWRLLRLLNVRATCDGAPPRSGLLVCNHLSYLDIVVLAARHPMAFVAKKEVAAWPLIGAMARLGGTLFIDRDQRRDVVRMGGAVVRAIAQGVTVCVFPEGTSSGGAEVLPFRPSLFQPAVDHGWNVTPARIAYRLEEGEGLVADEVCYWREMRFFTHFFNLLGKRSIAAHVSFGPAMASLRGRKELAASAHAEVQRLPAFPGMNADREKQRA